MVIYNLCEQKEVVRTVANYGIAVPPKSAQLLNFSPFNFPNFLKNENWIWVLNLGDSFKLLMTHAC